MKGYGLIVDYNSLNTMKILKYNTTQKLKNNKTFS